MTGEIPSTLGGLTQLTYLNLYGNALTGPIPDGMGDLVKLQWLFLGRNALTGEIPAALGKLQSLRKLYLDRMDLEGCVPVDLRYIELDTSNSGDLRVDGLPFCAEFIISTASVAMEEGGSATYTIALTAAPAAPVTVTPTSSDAAVVTVSAALTFTADDWEAPQPVTVTGVDDDIVNDSVRTASIAHAVTSTDSNYDGIDAEAVTVTLTDDDRTCADSGAASDCETLLGLRDALAGAGMLDWVLSTPMIEWEGVTVESGRVTKLELRAKGLSGTIPAGLGDLEQLTHLDLQGNEFTGGIPSELGRLGQLTYLNLYDNALTGAIPAELGDLEQLQWLYLGRNALTGDVPESLGNLTALNALYLDRTMVTGCIPAILSSLDSDRLRTDLPFCPSVPTVARILENIKFCVGDTVEISLAGAFIDLDKDVLSYAASAADPTIVGVSLVGDLVTLTPLSAGETAVTVTATDPSNNSVEQVVAVAVCDPDGEVRQRFRKAGERILPKVTQALVSGTLTAVTERVETLGSSARAETDYNVGGLATSDSTWESTLYSLLQSSARTFGNEDTPFDWAGFLDNSSFSVPLAGAAGGSGDSGWLSNVTLWGQGDYQNMSESSVGTANRDLEWNGDLFNARLGVDARVHPQVLAGASVSWGQGSFDWQDPSRFDGTPVSGELGVEMTSVHPYAGWSSADGGLGVWGTLGYGRGDVEMDETASVRGKQSSDSTLKNVAAGVTGKLLSNEDLIPGGATTLRAKGEASLARFDVEGSGLIDPLQVDTQRLRLILEMEHERPLPGEGRLAPSLQLGLRHDAGGDKSGTGVEAGVGLRYLHTGYGLTVEGRGRVLSTPGSSYDEWGGDIMISMDPGMDRRGLTFQLAAGYGETASTLQRLWEQDMLDPRARMTGVFRPEARMEAEVRYGTTGLRGAGLFTPYSRLSLTGSGDRRSAIGGRFSLNDRLDLKFEGERREWTTGAAGIAVDHGIQVEGRMQF